MTDKEKAKAYDEAIERANKQRADYQKELDKTDKNSQLSGLLRAAISAIDMVFPELAESEDEKIRKVLLNLVSDDKAAGYTKFYEEQGITCDDAIAYLEKQKEPIDPFDTKLFQDGVKEGRRLEREDIMRKEQKPVENNYPDYNPDEYEVVEDGNATKLVRKQKPAECVTDAEMKKGLDELTKFKQFASALSDMYNIIPSHSSLRPKDIDWNNFCAGLMTYLKNHQPAEWSEEDITNGWTGVDSERYFSCLQRLGTGNPQQPETINSIWFKKHCRPQLHWKPSEEQMDVLKEAVFYFSNSWVSHKQEVLESLYNDLKKL